MTGSLNYIDESSGVRLLFQPFLLCFHILLLVLCRTIEILVHHSANRFAGFDVLQLQWHFLLYRFILELIAESIRKVLFDDSQAADLGVWKFTIQMILLVLLYAILAEKLEAEAIATKVVDVVADVFRTFLFDSLFDFSWAAAPITRIHLILPDYYKTNAKIFN